MYKIAHLGDIHVQDNRREEYAAVFARLYAQLRQEQPHIIVLAGDVFDSKTRASAHNFADVAAFLTELTAIAPLIMIPGNHDVAMNAAGAPDLLTPVVADHRRLQPPALQYWRQSGVYAAHGIVWVVVAPDGECPTEAEIAEKRAEFEAAKLINEHAPHFCLFHEEIGGAKLPNGQDARDTHLTMKDFAQFDAVFGGDNHVCQNLSPRVSYCGSLVQQNISESHLEHGYLLWEVAGSKAHAPYRTAPPLRRLVRVPNDRGFLRVRLAAGADVTPEPRPARPYYYEVIYDEATLTAQVTEAAQRCVERYGFPPRSTKRTVAKEALPRAPRAKAASALAAEESKDATDAADAAGATHAAAPVPPTELELAQEVAQSFNTHEELVRELLGAEHRYLAPVLAMYKERCGLTTQRRTGRARVRLLRLEFDNMYCYGTGNVVDFTKLEGCMSGVVAPNRAGKSSLVDIITYALFDCVLRGAVKTIANAAAVAYRVRLEFELDGQLGVIEKHGLRGSGRASLKPHVFEYAGVNRTQGTKTLTCAEIRKYVGECSDTMLTSVSSQISTQEGGPDFLRMTPGQRRDALNRLLGLGAHASLEDAAYKEATGLNAAVKTLKAQYAGTSVDALTERVEALEGDCEDLRLSLAEARPATEAAQLASAEVQVALGATKAELDQAERAYAALHQDAPADEDADAAPSMNASAELVSALAGALAIDPEAADCRVAAGKSITFLKTLTARLAIVPTLPTPPDLALSSAESACATEAQLLDDARQVLAARSQLAALLAERNAAKVRVETAHERWAAAQAQGLAEPPEVPRPAAGAAVWPSERRAPRPSDAEVKSALAYLAESSPAPPEGAASHEVYQLAAQAAWRGAPADPARLAALQAQQTCAAPDSAIARVSSALLEKELKEIAAEYIPDEKKHIGTIRGMSGAEVDRLADSAVAPEGVLALAAQCEQARAEERGLAQCTEILRKLDGSLQADCAGCAAVRVLTASGAPEAAAARAEAAQAALDAAYRACLASKLKRLSQCKGQYAAAAAAEKEAQAAEARERENSREIAELTAAQCGEEACRQRAEHWTRAAAAIATLEAAAYWWRQDTEHWARYDSITSAAGSRAALEKEKTQLVAALKTAAGAYEAHAALAKARADDIAAKCGVRQDKLERFLAAATREARRAERARRGVDVQAALAARDAARARFVACQDAVRKAAGAGRAALHAQNSLSDRLAAAQTAYATAKAQLAAEQRRAQAEGEAAAKADMMKAYRDVISTKMGVPVRLLERARGEVEARINIALTEIAGPASFSIALTEDFDIILKQPSADGSPSELPADLGSGYQRFVISRAARAALTALAEVPILDCCLLDEGFGCLDAATLPAVTEYFEAASRGDFGGPKLFFIISHLEFLKGKLRRPLRIAQTGSLSHVNNAGDAPAGALPAPLTATAVVRPPPVVRKAGRPAGTSAAAIAAAAPVEADVAPLLPDPNDPKKVWCPECQKSMRAGFAVSHKTTAVHLASVKRVAKAGGIHAGVAAAPPAGADDEKEDSMHADEE
jgi:DNA repair exonuclease SbcCD ATPase subunit